MKKVLSILLAVAILTSVCVFSAMAASETVMYSQDFENVSFTDHQSNQGSYAKGAIWGIGYGGTATRVTKDGNNVISTNASSNSPARHLFYLPQGYFEDGCKYKLSMDITFDPIYTNNGTLEVNYAFVDSVVPSNGVPTLWGIKKTVVDAGKTVTVTSGVLNYTNAEYLTKTINAAIMYTPGHDKTVPNDQRDIVYIDNVKLIRVGDGKVQPGSAENASSGPSTPVPEVKPADPAPSTPAPSTPADPDKAYVSLEEAIQIMNKKGIIQEPEKWAKYGEWEQENIYWLLRKLATSMK